MLKEKLEGAADVLAGRPTSYKNYVYAAQAYKMLDSDELASALIDVEAIIHTCTKTREMLADNHASATHISNEELQELLKSVPEIGLSKGSIRCLMNLGIGALDRAGLLADFNPDLS